MKNVFLLFSTLALFWTIKVKPYSNQQRLLVRMDVLRQAQVDRQFTLHIPRSIKFGDELVRPERAGTIYIKVADKKFCFVRPVEITRNEYFFSANCGDDVRFLDVSTIDVISINFDKSNMLKAGNVPLYGEETI